MTRCQLMAVGTALLALAIAAPSVAIDSAKYTVTLHQGPFEFRDYPATVVAVAAVDGTRGNAVNSGFRLLADYIFGNNQQKTRIAMTAPVTQSRSPGRVVTPPPAKGPVRATWIVRFMMPAGSALQSLPAPNDHRVHFELMRDHRVAAIRFSGFWSDTNLATHETQLLQWVQQQHVTPSSAPTYAYYDPPWTPWFLRRIEVLIEVVPAA